MVARTRSLSIGQVGTRRFTLPLELASLTMAIVGVRGAGKTVTASVIVEEVIAAGIPCVIIDPTDVWWGLKSSRDGKSVGLPVVVFGGAHSDLPLPADAGAAIADFVVANPMPVVLSLRHLRKGAQRQFVTAFFEQLYHRKGEPEHRTPLFVALDEASQFVPQRVGATEARLVGAVQDIVRLGRAAGFGVALIDQRPASVNKDVLTQLELLVSHRITSPQDRKALTEWIQQHDAEQHRGEFLAQLADLPTGTAWFWSPPFDGLFARVAVRNRDTFDSSRTPKIGERAIAPAKLASVDLEKIRGELDAALQRAEENDPKRLHARIAELEKQLRNGSRDPRVAELEAAVLRLEQDRDMAIAYYTRKFDDQNERHLALVLNVADLAGRITEAIQAAPPPLRLDKRTPVPGTGKAASAPVAVQRPAAAPVRPRAGHVAAPVDGDVPAPLRRILGAVAQFEQLGITEPERQNVGAIAGYTASGGTFNRYVSELSSRGLIEYPGPGTVRLTDAGRAAAPAIDVPATLQQLHESWLSLKPIGGPHRALMEVLLQQYPSAMRRDDLATACGYTASGGTFNRYVSTLSSLGMVEYPDRGTVRAADLLFPAGLR